MASFRFLPLLYCANWLLGRGGIRRVLSLDDRSRMALYRLMNHGVIAKLQHPIRQGKESLVLHALAPDGRELAVKVHTSKVFGERERKQYLFGDWRLRHARHHIAQRTETIWAEKELRNLARLEKARVPAPRPVAFDENVVVMGFIGKDGEAAPQLNNEKSLDYPRIAARVLASLTLMVSQAKLVHGDLSPYNILVWKKQPYLIDLSQAVLTTHPEAKRLLERDIANLKAFFASVGVDHQLFLGLSAELMDIVEWN